MPKLYSGVKTASPELRGVDFIRDEAGQLVALKLLISYHIVDNTGAVLQGAAETRTIDLTSSPPDSSLGIKAFYKNSILPILQEYA